MEEHKERKSRETGKIKEIIIGMEIPLRHHHNNEEDRIGVLDFLAHSSHEENNWKVSEAQEFETLQSFLERIALSQ